MAVLKITEHDILTERLRLVLEDIAELDDPEQDFPELRRKAHAALGKIEAQAASAGYSPAELYGYVIGMEEGRADLAAFGPWGNSEIV